MNIISEYYAANGVSYGVVRKNDSYYQVYKYGKSDFGDDDVDDDVSEFITHRDTLKSARKIAILLAHAYKQGYADGSY